MFRASFAPDAGTVIAIVLLVLVVIFIIQAFKVVPQQSAWVVERLGKFHAVLQLSLIHI